MTGTISPFRRIAFQSLRRLSECDFKDQFDSFYVKNVIEPGLLYHFRNPDLPLRVFFDIDPDGLYAAVHVEMKTDDQHHIQPWLFSLVREPVDPLSGKTTLSFEDTKEPFPVEDYFFWPCDYLTPEESVRGVRAWADHFWPDWQPHVEVLRLATLETFYQYLLSEGSSEGLRVYHCFNVPDPAISFMGDAGMLILHDKDDGLIVHASPEHIKTLIAKFPGVTVKTVSRQDYEPPYGG